jgi:hypothetical protein
MKKDCEYTGKLLKKYLLGHLFKLQKNRVERHLKSCVVCRSEFEALKRIDETRQFLKDVTPEEGILSRLKKGFSAAARLKKIIYRPLWVAGIALLAAAGTYYVVTPTPLDVELESIVKTTPSTTVSTAIGSSPVVISAPAATVPASAGEPLMITITLAQENERKSIRRINEVMREYDQLWGKKFSDTVREISGSLTAKELLTFFSRIKTTGTISYNRSRIESQPKAQPLPFVLTLKRAPQTAKNPAAPAKPVKRRMDAVDAAPAPAPAPPVTAPTPSAVQ